MFFKCAHIFKPDDASHYLPCVWFWMMVVGSFCW